MQSLSAFVQSRGISMLIYGRSNTGKTSAIRTLPAARTVIISFEPQQSANALWHWGWREWRIETPLGHMDMDQIVNRIRRDDTVDHVVVDTMSAFQEQLELEFLRESGKTKDQLGFLFWNNVSERFRRCLENLLTLCSAGKDVIMLAHMKYKSTGKGDDITIHKWPAFYGDWPEHVSKRIPITLRSERYKIGKEVHYCLEISGGQEDYGGDKLHVLDQSQPNDVMAILKKLRGAFNAAGELPESQHSSLRPNTQLPPAAPNSRTFPTEASRKGLLDALYKKIETLGEEVGVVRMVLKEKLGCAVSIMTKEQLEESIKIVDQMVAERNVDSASDFDFGIPNGGTADENV